MLDPFFPSGQIRIWFLLQADSDPFYFCLIGYGSRLQLINSYMIRKKYFFLTRKKILKKMWPLSRGEERKALGAGLLKKNFFAAPLSSPIYVLVFWYPSSDISCYGSSSFFVVGLKLFPYRTTTFVPNASRGYHMVVELPKGLTSGGIFKEFKAQFFCSL